MERHISFDTQARALMLLDQRVLPVQEVFVACRTTADIIDALQVMVVRGAPAIGVTAAWGCVLALYEVCHVQGDWRSALQQHLAALRAARPTAINLAWAVDRMQALWTPAMTQDALLACWMQEAASIQHDDIEINKAMGQYGAAVLESGDTVMTHCNAGALATAGYGTALGIIRGAIEAGKKIHVIANETRPFLQGARLTAYELAEDGIPVHVACDNACALLMQKGLVQKVVVGADRIAANGDAANKIGTYGVALLAKAHGIPFYVAAPLSTIDPLMPDGRDIPIEERPAREVTHVGDVRLTPEAVPVYNFAFDVTPAVLLAGIITEVGVLRAPYGQSIAAALKGKK